MDTALLKANVMLSIMDMNHIDDDTLMAYLETGCHVVNEGNKSNELFLMMIETFAKNAGSFYDKILICNYMTPIISSMAKKFEIALTDSECSIIANYVAICRRKAFVPNDIVKYDEYASNYIDCASLLDSYMNKNEVLFYIVYRLNSELLENIIGNIKENKTIAYDCATRMNRCNEYYDSIVFDGKN